MPSVNQGFSMTLAGMKHPRRFSGHRLAMALILAVLSLPASLISAEEGGVFIERLGISFNRPEGFKLGRFKELPMPPSLEIEGYDSPFKDAAVLVEPAELASPRGQVYSVQAIPVGEVPVIWIDRLRGNRARFNRSLLREGQAKSIGPLTVYQLPGFPGPYGDSAFYYLIPLEGGDMIEIGAHKFYFRAAHSPARGELGETHYDNIIETLIATLSVSASR